MSLPRQRLIARLEDSRAGSFLVQLLRYFWVAMAGLVVDFLLLFLLTTVFSLYFLIGTAAGFVGGLIVTYFLGERFVFHSPKISSGSTRFAIFGLIGLVGLGLLSLLMWLLTDVGHLYYLFSKVLATVVVYLWNFLARRKLYGPSGSEQAPIQAAEEIP
jgi:putative flippase GtrA